MKPNGFQRIALWCLESAARFPMLSFALGILLCIALAVFSGWHLAHSGDLLYRIWLYLLCVGIAGGCILGEAYRQHRRAQAAPGQPWLWRTDWARGCVVSKRFTDEALVPWAFFGLLTFVFGGFEFILWKCAHDETDPLSVGLWFWLPVPLVGAFFVYAIYVTWRWKRRGGATLLKLTTLPGRTGGELAGVINLARRPKAAKGFTASLQCVRVIVKDDDEEDQREILHTLASTAAAPLMPHEVQPGRLGFPITFRIPAECPACNTNGVDEDIQWELIVKACARGDNYQAVFEVPVFAPGAAHA